MNDDFNTLLIAHKSSPDLPSLRDTILAFAAPSLVRVSSSLDTALGLIRDGWFPDFVVVYQGVADEFPSAQIDELIGRLPLARFVVAFGPWCESLGRTEQRWPIACCVPIRHAPVRIEREVAWLNSDRPASPPTASRDEAFSVTAARANSEALADRGLSAVVVGSDRPFVELIRDQLRAGGVSVVTADSGDPDFVFLTATKMSDTIATQRDQLREQFPDAARILISDLLTPAEVEKLHSEGVATMSQLRLGEELAALATASER